MITFITSGFGDQPAGPLCVRHEMNSESLIAEARAKIIWGEPIPAVRAFLTSQGMSVTDADTKIHEFMRERDAEIRGLGLKKTLIGLGLIGVSAILFYTLFAVWDNLPELRGRTAGGYGIVALVAFYGLWKLVDGIVYLIRPKSEHGSVPDLTP